MLEEAIEEHGAPEYIRSDNGPEFIATAIQQWLKDKGIKTIYIDPGSPWQNGYVESFNDKFRGECLNRELIYTLNDPMEQTNLIHQLPEKTAQLKAIWKKESAAFLAPMKWDLSRWEMMMK